MFKVGVFFFVFFVFFLVFFLVFFTPTNPTPHSRRDCMASEGLLSFDMIYGYWPALDNMTLLALSLVNGFEVDYQSSKLHLHHAPLLLLPVSTLQGRVQQLGI